MASILRTFLDITAMRFISVNHFIDQNRFMASKNMFLILLLILSWSESVSFVVIHNWIEILACESSECEGGVK